MQTEQAVDYKAINKATWDKRTLTHVKSKFYDVAGFKQGKCTLNPLELELMGDVTGKSLLHLQCHFGLDTLSFARLGAQVTGVDISAEAVKQAQALTQELGLSAEFIADDIYDFGARNTREYDLVFTSYGVLCWLPDLALWAELIAKSLKPGGELHLVEFHPIADAMMGYPYFGDGAPSVDEEGTYTENCDGSTSSIVTWAHTLADVISSLAGAGLSIELVTESAGSPYDCFEDAELRGDGLYYVQHKGHDLPLIYSVKARKSE